MDARTGQPVQGVAVSVDDVTGSLSVAQPTASAVTHPNGEFVCPGSHRLDLWSGYVQAFRVRFHRNGYDDTAYDFIYTARIALLGDRKPIGQIVLRPEWQR